MHSKCEDMSNYEFPHRCSCYIKIQYEYLNKTNVKIKELIKFLNLNFYGGIKHINKELIKYCISDNYNSIMNIRILPSDLCFK